MWRARSERKTGDVKMIGNESESNETKQREKRRDGKQEERLEKGKENDRKR